MCPAAFRACGCARASFLKNRPLYGHIQAGLSGRLGRSHLLAVTMVHVHGFVWIQVFRAPGYTPGKGTSGSCGNAREELSSCFPKRLHHLRFPQRWKRFTISDTFTDTCRCLSDDGQPSGRAALTRLPLPLMLHSLQRRSRSRSATRVSSLEKRLSRFPPPPCPAAGDSPALHPWELLWE